MSNSSIPLILADVCTVHSIESIDDKMFRAVCTRHSGANIDFVLPKTNAVKFYIGARFTLRLGDLEKTVKTCSCGGGQHYDGCAEKNFLRPSIGEIPCEEDKGTTFQDPQKGANVAK